jgi:hypothetical protein
MGKTAIKNPLQFGPCERCKHGPWLGRRIKVENGKIVGVKPKVCPSCKSPYWDTPREA